jgi:hypothetical protein
MTRFLLVTLVAASIASGCYHAAINTGVQPGAGRSHTLWKHSWLWGLVPPSTTDASAKCEGQPASNVETQLSFTNQLVTFLTGGIYTPMTVKVTCGQR